LILDPKNIQSMTNKSALLGDLNQPERVIEIIDQILQLKPNYNIALLNKALFLFKLNRQEEANKIYDFLISNIQVITFHITEKQKYYI